MNKEKGNDAALHVGIAKRSWDVYEEYANHTDLIFTATCIEDFDPVKFVELVGDTPIPMKVKNIVIISEYPPHNFMYGPLTQQFLASIDEVINMTA